MLKNGLFQLMLIGVVISSAQADIINVPGDQPTIQGAINIAAAGDIILVAPGNYPEQIDFIGKAVHIQSASGSDHTTIQAVAPGSIVTAANGETPASQLEGFTLEGGDGLKGGGIHINGGSPTIRNCVIRDCLATLGGGAYVESGDPSFHWCRFEGNIASSGAGLYVNGNASIDDCDFDSNFASATGGAIQVDFGFIDGNKIRIENNEAGNNIQDQGSGAAIYGLESTMELDDITCKDNLAWTAGGIWSYRCVIDVSNSLFERNMAEKNGGSAMAYYGSHQYENCTILDGQAENGAGLMHQYSLVTMRDCEFKTNTAFVNGGGFYGIDLGQQSRLDSSSLSGNSAESGAGMMVTGSSEFKMNFNVFTSNIASIDGGGLHAEWSSFNSNQCGFLGNTSGRHGAAMSLVDCDGQFRGWQAGQNVADVDGGVVHAIRGSQYFFGSDFQSNTAKKGAGVACRACDVLVSGSSIRVNDASLSGGGFHIEVPGELMLGGSLVCGNQPDQIVGPFQEFGPNTIAPECSDCDGDVDADSFIGIDDLLAVINAWGACVGCAEDVDGDGVVDISDLLTVLKNWGWCD
ncbi:MAG: hypothetical protein P8M22_03940 [Phycisphaerales bacterium]|nr:hypothetical protein [Phycisphaerales bacterium]